jgi:16S rRNA (cytosine1402-N4)-methyltransferase
MSDAPAHIPVLLAEVIGAVTLERDPGATRPDVIVDATFGAGGYSRALLAHGVQVVAFDRDPGAARFADDLSRAYPDRFRLINRPFSELEAGLADAGQDGCDGVVFDLGVSSMQLDEADRGFSFMRDGPLDMRMSQTGETAADLVNTAPEAELIRLFRLYGEEPKARRIAGALVRRRSDTPFTRTLDLADIIEQAVGGRRGAPTHPATRVFQALRIAVNDELDELETALDAAERTLRPGGRLATVTFHSLEDRIAKAFLTERTGRLPSGSRHLPPLARGPAPTFSLAFTGALGPQQVEIDANPRARSAKLRVAIRTQAPAWTTEPEGRRP